MGARLKGRLISPSDRKTALERLSASTRRNLFLLDMIKQVGRSANSHETPTQVLGAWLGGELRGLAGIRPSLVLEADLADDALETFLSYFDGIEAGLVKSAEAPVTALWERLERCGRRALLDRREHTYVLEPGRLRGVPALDGVHVRPAHVGDWGELVTAARASLREEDRPDPFEGDPTGFRLWVRGRIPRARVVEVDGRLAFVGYADVRLAEGWLVQGVYTWPEFRRRGLAAAGMTALAEEAFAAGAEHVQLAVVDGNAPAISLYRGLGFEPTDVLRTILFT